MSMGDNELDRLGAVLDAGGVVEVDTIRELIDEVRGSRISLDLAAKAVGLVGREAVILAVEAKRLVEGYRDLAPSNDDACVVVELPDGFGPPELGRGG